MCNCLFTGVKVEGEDLVKEGGKGEEKEVNVLVLAWTECEESMCVEQE